MRLETGGSGLTRGTDLLAILGVVTVVQVLLTYRALVGDGALVVDNLYWPFVVLAFVIGYVDDRLSALTYRLAVTAVGTLLSIVAFALAPGPEKLLLASLLSVAAIYYLLEAYAHGSRTTIASP